MQTTLSGGWLDRQKVIEACDATEVLVARQRENLREAAITVAIQPGWFFTPTREQAEKIVDRDTFSIHTFAGWVSLEVARKLRRVALVSEGPTVFVTADDFRMISCGWDFPDNVETTS